MIDSPAVVPSFNDRYAYRPTGSTTVALIAILDDLTQLLNSQHYVHVPIVGLGFSKAFDKVRHSTLMDKQASFPVNDSVYYSITS